MVYGEKLEIDLYGQSLCASSFRREVAAKDQCYLPWRFRAVRYLPARLWWFCRSCHDPVLCPVLETWRLSGCNQYRRKCRGSRFFFLDNLSALGAIPTTDDQAARLYIIGRRRGVVIHWDRATAVRCADPVGRLELFRECRLWIKCWGTTGPGG